jgi:mannose-6-phosphate isomerase-like protein (cupin superfamily)
MKIAGKAWGKTAEVFATPAFELHRLEISGQHRCSRHYHQAKFNGLYVESGAIQVTVWQPEGTVDYTVLTAGESIVVPPGVDHMFVGVAPKSLVFETYWTELSRGDIVRKNTGE